MLFFKFIPNDAGQFKYTIKTVIYAGAFLVSGMVGAQAQVVSVTQTVNLRQGPGVQYARIAALPRGAAVHVDVCRNGWCRVQSSWGIGWTSGRYLSGANAASYAPDYATRQSQLYLGLNIVPGFAYDDPFYTPYYNRYSRPYYRPPYRPYYHGYRPYTHYRGPHYGGGQRWNPRWGVGPVRPSHGIPHGIPHGAARGGWRR